MRRAGIRGELPVREVEVATANLAALEVFTRCDLEAVGTPGGIFWRPSRPETVAAVAGLCGHALTRELFDTVRRMGAAVARKRMEAKG